MQEIARRSIKIIENMPKVSVITPVYGVEKYIERCARSLFEQTLDDIEYLFIDDCTPDRSIEVLRKVLENYPQRKPQVTIHRMESNSGQAKVREWGMRHATGEYLIHCDSDDWLMNDMYEKLYKKAVEESASIVFCNYSIADDNGNLKEFDKKIQRLDSHYIIHRLLVDYSLNPIWSVLVKTSLITNLIYPTGAQTEDKTMLIQLSNMCDKFAFINEPLYFYRDNPSSISNSNNTDSIIRRFKQSYDNAVITKKYAETNCLYEEFEKEFVVYLYTLRRFFIDNLKSKKCREIWQNTYPGLGVKFYLSPIVSLGTKLIYLLASLRCFFYDYLKYDKE